MTEIVQEPLRDRVARAIYEEPGKEGDWYSLSEVRREPWRRDADRALQEAGIKGQIVERRANVDSTLLRVEVERLRSALRDIVSDVLEYEKINNLAPSPGRKFCWRSVERANAILAQSE